jgi:hypothetical protein
MNAWQLGLGAWMEPLIVQPGAHRDSNSGLHDLSVVILCLIYNCQLYEWEAKPGRGVGGGRQRCWCNA